MYGRVCVRLGMCRKTKSGRNKDVGKQDLRRKVPKSDVGCIRYRKSVSGLTGRVPENEAGVPG